MHAHNDNSPTTRPASFDAMLVDYRPAMRRTAARLGFFGDEADYLVLDTIATCLANWASYRPGPTPWPFFRLHMLNVARQRRVVANRNRMFVEDPDGRHASTLASAPAQEHVVDLKRAVAALDSRGGNVVVCVAMGETFKDVGVSMGVSRQRAEQLANAAVARVAALLVAA